MERGENAVAKDTTSTPDRVLSGLLQKKIVGAEPRSDGKRKTCSWTRLFGRFPLFAWSSEVSFEPLSPVLGSSLAPPAGLERKPPAARPSRAAPRSEGASTDSDSSEGSPSSDEEEAAVAFPACEDDTAGNVEGDAEGEAASNQAGKRANSAPRAERQANV